MKHTIIILLYCTILFGCSDGYPELGGGYKIVGEGGYATSVVDSLNTQMISEYILDYAIDSNFILIGQSPPDSLPEMKTFIYSDSDRKEIATNKNVFRNYWIIDKKRRSERRYDSIRHRETYSNVYGPFDFDYYQKQKQLLNVSDNLKLENE